MLGSWNLPLELSDKDLLVLAAIVQETEKNTWTRDDLSQILCHVIAAQPGQLHCPAQMQYKAQIISRFLWNANP